MKELQYLNKYFKKYKYRLIIGLIITIVSNYFKLFTPVLIRKSLNVVEDYIQLNKLTLPEVKSELILNILLLFGSILAAGILTFFMRQTLIVVSRLIEFDLKNEIYNKYQVLSLDFYKKNKIGDLMNRITEDVGQVRMYVGPALMYSINTITLFVIVIYNMLSINKELTFYTLLPLPFLSFFIYYISIVIHKKSTVVQEYLSKITSYVQEHISGISVIKNYTKENQSIDNFKLVAEESKQKKIDLAKVQALFFPLMLLLIGISNLLVIYIGGKQYIDGKIENIGYIIEFIIYVNMLTWPVATVGWVSAIIQKAAASQKRINQFLKEGEVLPKEGENTNTLKGQITFNKVDYTYKDTNINALKNVSFNIDNNQTTAIVGLTGSGKSTIFNLLLRLYDSSNGKITIDNVNINEYDLSFLRNNFGYVTQEPFLFSDTILNNVKVGKQDATKEEVMKFCKLAKIHESIIEFKDGYDTILGERGITLSGGQKQRLSIARALIKNPKILLFDDALSALDTETEEQVLKNIQEIGKEKTVLIITHRISSAKYADQILVFDKGYLISNGSFNDLMNKKELFFELFSDQMNKKN